MKYRLIANGAPYGDNESIGSVNTVKEADRICRKELAAGQGAELIDLSGKVRAEWKCDGSGKVYRMAH